MRAALSRPMQTHPYTSSWSVRQTASTLALFLLAAGLAGCTNTPSSAPSASAAAAAPAAANSIAVDGTHLHKGDTADKLLAAVGEPDERKPFRADEIAAEVWIYKRRIPGAVRQVPSSTRDVPYVDPLTGNMRMLQEPVYSNERTTFDETTELLLINGQLAEWKQWLRESRTHD